MSDATVREPIAVTAVGAHFPGRGGAGGFWRDVVAGIDASTGVPSTHWSVEDYFDPDPSVPDKTYSDRGAFIPAFPFDPVAFGTPPQVVETTDTVQLLALYVARQVLAEARRGAAKVDPARIGVVLGVAAGTELIGDMCGRIQRPVWLRAMRQHGLGEAEATALADRITAHYGPWRESTFPGLLGNVVAGRVTNRFDLGGVNFTADAACASSLAALRHAAQELWLGECDMVLAGGADTLNNIFMYMCFSKTPAMSPTGRARAFSDDADGTLMGEGCGMLALRRLSDAERDGDPIYALLRGVGASSDGRGGAVYAPQPKGQALALRRTYEAAGYSPATVELVEAHGTGTKAGDAAEFAALSAVFAEAAQDRADGQRRWCALGSVKSQIGHTKSAAGAAGAIKAIGALRSAVLPPAVNMSRPNPKLGVEDSPFHFSTEARPWISGAAHPRRASVSSFGFGGSNFHATFEEYRGPAPRANRWRAVPSELFLACGPDAAAALAALGRFAHDARREDGFADAAWRSQRDFRPDAPQRLAVVAADAGALDAAVDAAQALIARATPQRVGAVHYGAGAATASAPVAFVFAGQGSQHLGMGAGLAMNFEVARTVWDRAAAGTGAASRAHLLAFPPSAFDADAARAQESALRRTEYAQPAIGLAALAQLALLDALRVAPDMLAGHSFGEVMALHAGGAMDADDAVALAEARGAAMAQAAHGTDGAMLAVLAPRAAVAAAVAGIDGVVVANDNAPRQVVLSGPTPAIDLAEAAAAAAGMQCRRLPVATAFHSPLVAGAAEALRGVAAQRVRRAPVRPVYANATAARYPQDVDAARDLLCRQIGEGVRFREMIEAMHRDGARIFVEIGPSAHLTGMIGAILSGRDHLAVAMGDRKAGDDVTAMHHALAALAVAGREIDFTALWADAPAPTPQPAPPKHALMLTGANHNKPYPAGAAMNDAPPAPRSRAVEAFDHTILSPEKHPAAGDGRLSALDRIAEEHRRFVETMAQAHGAFLQAATLCAGAQRAPEEDASRAPRLAAGARLALAEAEEATRSPAPAPAASAAAAPAVAAAAPAAPAPVAAAPTPAAPAPFTAPEAPHPVAPAETTPAAAEAVVGAIRAVVARETGYPEDMIGADMDLEAELGIDSIKQVEIFSALRDALPEAAALDPSAIAELRTIAHIAAALAGGAAPVAVCTTAARREALRRLEADAAAHGLHRQVVETSPAPEPRFRVALRGKRVDIVGDAPAFATAIADRLRADGVDARVVDAPDADADVVVATAGLAELEPLETCRRLLAGARAIALGGGRAGVRLVVLQVAAAPCGPAPASLREAARGAACGLVKTAAQEWQAASARVIEVDPGYLGDPARLADAVVNELAITDAPVDVAVACDGARTTTVERTSPYDGAGVVLQEGWAVVVSGGARGVTAAVVRRMATRTRLRFLLLGRTPRCAWPPDLPVVDDVRALRLALVRRAQQSGAPVDLKAISASADRLLAAREVEATLAELAALGSEARYVVADVADAAAVREAVAAFSAAAGPIRGLVHGAGVVADKLIADKTDAQLAAVFTVKVAGLMNLWAAVDPSALRFAGLFSSVAARFGSAGQADYALANAALNRMAWAMQAAHPHLRVASVGWGPWLGGMVHDGLRRKFEAEGVPLIPVEIGAAAFLAEIESSGPPEVIFSGRRPADMEAMSAAQ